MPLMKERNKPRIAPETGVDTLPVLLAALDGAAADGRRRAALALGAHPGAAGALLARVDREGDSAVRHALITALATIANAEAVAGLVRCLASEDVWLRNAAIDALRQMPDQVAPLMGHLLTDADRDVRILAIGVLDTLRHPDVERWLLHVIDIDEDVNVCGTALDLLAELATPASAEPVRALLARFPGQPYLRFAGELALRRATGG
jgi:HEAT repeat protein